MDTVRVLFSGNSRPQRTNFRHIIVVGIPSVDASNNCDLSRTVSFVRDMASWDASNSFVWRVVDKFLFGEDLKTVETKRELQKDFGKEFLSLHDVRCCEFWKVGMPNICEGNG